LLLAKVCVAVGIQLLVESLECAVVQPLRVRVARVRLRGLGLGRIQLTPVGLHVVDIGRIEILVVYRILPLVAVHPPVGDVLVCLPVDLERGFGMHDVVIGLDVLLLRLHGLVRLQLVGSNLLLSGAHVLPPVQSRLVHGVCP